MTYLYIGGFNMPTVKITISKNGEVKREASGFVGTACTEKTAFLDDVLGVAETEELKDSYHQEGVISDGLPAGWCG
jgi:hypothetical protein